MRELRVYLDSSAIVKRYIKEIGSDLIKDVYKKADGSGALLTFSLWNIGEVLGILDTYMKRKWINPDELGTALGGFAGETLRLVRLLTLEVVPITFDLLSEAWKIVLHYHIYEADAIQVATAKNLGAEIFLSADQKLLEVATQENLNTINVESEDEKLRRIF